MRSPRQARLALTGAADRAAALGGYDQAVAYLEQALAITTDPAERAPLLDRAARSAGRPPRADAERYAEAAVAAYRELGDRIGGAAATARLGKLLIEAGEMPAGDRGARGGGAGGGGDRG